MYQTSRRRTPCRRSAWTWPRAPSKALCTRARARHPLPGPHRHRGGHRLRPAAPDPGSQPEPAGQPAAADDHEDHADVPAGDLVRSAGGPGPLLRGVEPLPGGPAVVHQPQHLRHQAGRPAAPGSRSDAGRADPGLLRLPQGAVLADRATPTQRRPRAEEGGRSGGAAAKAGSAKKSPAKAARPSRRPSSPAEVDRPKSTAAKVGHRARPRRTSEKASSSTSKSSNGASVERPDLGAGHARRRRAAARQGHAGTDGRAGPVPTRPSRHDLGDRRRGIEPSHHRRAAHRPGLPPRCSRGPARTRRGRATRGVGRDHRKHRRGGQGRGARSAGCRRAGRRVRDPRGGQERPVRADPTRGPGAGPGAPDQSPAEGRAPGSPPTQADGAKRTGRRATAGPPRLGSTRPPKRRPRRPTEAEAAPSR